MSKVKARKEILNTKWDSKDDMICCCPYNNPRCINYKECELLEVIINPYEGIEEACKNTRRKFKRINNRIRQISY